MKVRGLSSSTGNTQIENSTLISQTVFLIFQSGKITNLIYLGLSLKGIV